MFKECFCKSINLTVKFDDINQRSIEYPVSNMTSGNEPAKNDSLGKQMAGQFFGDKYFAKILENMVSDSSASSETVNPRIGWLD